MVNPWVNKIKCSSVVNPVHLWSSNHLVYRMKGYSVHTNSSKVLRLQITGILSIHKQKPIAVPSDSVIDIRQLCHRVAMQKIELLSRATNSKDM